MIAKTPRKREDLTDAEIAAVVDVDVAEIEKWNEWGCPRNDNGLWDVLSVIAWIEREIGEKYGRKQ